MERGTRGDEDRPRAVQVWVVMQRDDDTPESVNRRLDLYEEQTFPLIRHYGDQNRLAVVNGVGHPDAVFERLVKAVEQNRR
jgi:adenylate kinase